MEDLLAFLKKSSAGEMSVEEQVEFLSFDVTPSSAELTEAVRFLQGNMAFTVDMEDAIDICGTGGSGLARFNTSTVVAFVLSALGVPVAKHGNRSASGRVGSFDLLDQLGVRQLDEPCDLERLYRQTELAFLFARRFHPLMKEFAEARQLVGRPTFFNLLGPLLNPAGVKRQMIGTSFADKMELIALTCRELGHERVMVVRGDDGLDEVTLTGRTRVVELCDEQVREYFVDPSDFGIDACRFDEISGGDVRLNARISLDVLHGTCPTRHRDLVLVNAAMALKLVNKVATLREGYDMAKEVLESGKVLKQFQNVKSISQMPSILLKIVETKKREVAERKKRKSMDALKKLVTRSDRDFEEALRRHGLALIAEIKQASPSEGNISSGIFDPATIAQEYEQAGVSCISVLCDKEYFKGDLEHLSIVRKTTETTPLLCKDFIIDEYQIYEARQFGADAVLLIAGILSTKELTRFLSVTRELGMTALCEVYTEEELDKVLATDAKVIGINNRDLHSFDTDLGVSRRLVSMIPSDKVVISESGISSLTDVRQLPTRIDAILVGTSIMKSVDKKKKIFDLMSDRPLIKICGVREVTTAKFCSEIGVDMIGLNFVPSSRRHISVEMAKEICHAFEDSNMKVVGVFQNQSVDDVSYIAAELDLDFVQLSGVEDFEYLRQLNRPVILNVGVLNPEDLERARRLQHEVAFILFDSRDRGSGKSFDHRLLEGVDFPFLLAGGISVENVVDVMEFTRPMGVDIASGVETNGNVDVNKVLNLVTLLHSC